MKVLIQVHLYSNGNIYNSLTFSSVSINSTK